MYLIRKARNLLRMQGRPPWVPQPCVFMSQTGPTGAHFLQRQSLPIHDLLVSTDVSRESASLDPFPVTADPRWAPGSRGPDSSMTV